MRSFLPILHTSFEALVSTCPMQDQILLTKCSSVLIALIELLSIDNLGLFRAQAQAANLLNHLQNCISI